MSGFDFAYFRLARVAEAALEVGNTKSFHMSQAPSFISSFKFLLLWLARERIYVEESELR